MSLLIFYSNSVVILTQAMEHGKETNLVKYFVKMNPQNYFAVSVLFYCQMLCHDKGQSSSQMTWVGNAVTSLTLFC